nr:uncharacterized protein LOC117228141 [Megalopta genalis]
MLAVHQSRLFYQNTVLLRQTFYTGYAKFISDKAFQKFKLQQAQMQCDDGRPSFLKLGLRDKILYWTTLGLTTYGTVKGFLILREIHKD